VRPLQLLRLEHERPGHAGILALREAFTVVNGNILRRMLSVSNLTQYLPTTHNRRFKYALQTLDQAVQTLIDERCRGKHKDDLLSLLLLARDPERFSPQQSNERPRYAYFPFSRGPRACIGNHFALMEMQLVLAMAYQRFRFTLMPDKTVEPEPLLTLRPRGGIWMQTSRVH
jgi:cytochrome P450